MAMYKSALLALLGLNSAGFGFADEILYFYNGTDHDCYLLPQQKIHCHMEGSMKRLGPNNAGTEDYRLEAGTLLRIVPGLTLRVDIEVDQWPERRLRFELRTTVGASADAIKVQCQWRPSEMGFAAEHSLVLPEGLSPLAVQAVQAQGRWVRNYFSFTGPSSGQVAGALTHANGSAYAAASPAPASGETKSAPRPRLHGTKRRLNADASRTGLGTGQAAAAASGLFEPVSGSFPNPGPMDPPPAAASSSAAAAEPHQRPNWESPARKQPRSSDPGPSPAAPPWFFSPAAAPLLLPPSPQVRRVSFNGLETGLQLTATRLTTGETVNTFLSPSRSTLHFSLPAGTLLAMSPTGEAFTQAFPSFSLETLESDPLDEYASGDRPNGAAFQRGDDGLGEGEEEFPLLPNR